MEVKKGYKVFHYESEVRWKGGRRGVICSAGKPDLEVSSPPEFKGEAGAWTPEEMLVASVNACTMLSFVAFAQHKGLGFVSYESDAEGTLESVDGKYRITEVTLRPHVTVKSQEDVERAQAIMRDAHTNCFITNSITASVKVFPQFRAA